MARPAALTVRFTPVTVRAPKARTKDQGPAAALPLWAILVHEPDPPPGVEPVEWLLLSTLAAVPRPDDSTQRRVA